MNHESLRQTLRVHVMRLRQQQQQADGGGLVVGCTVDELVLQVEGALSTVKPDYGFGEALARLQLLMGGAASSSSSSPSPSSSSSSSSAVPHRRGSIGGRRGSISEVIDAEAMVSRLKTVA